MDQRQADKTTKLIHGYRSGPEGLVDTQGNITMFEMRVLRCVHHEFKAMTQAEAAVELGVSRLKIVRTLAKLEERAKTCRPIRVMFPVLTKQQFKVYTCTTKLGLATADTAKTLGLTEVAVDKMLTIMRSKGMSIPKRIKYLSYTPSMDKDVKEKY
jgi:DNA-binding transcriptional regulator LsrR (DeoR family)